MADVPQFSEDLIEQLDKLYPERSPRKGETLADIMFDAGQRSVVRALKERLRQQQNDDLMNKLKGE
jgi:hypothetical protein